MSPVELQLPFDSDEHDIVITQGFDGPYSHNTFSSRRVNYDMCYSADFALPVGAEISATRDGVIKWLIPGNGEVYTGIDPEEGRKVRAATIILEHPDVVRSGRRVYSYFQHLDPDSFRFEMGDSVRSGQPLARTGLTGWIGEIPHLHLSTFHHSSDPSLQTVPFSIEGYDGPLEDKDVIANMAEDSRAICRQILSIRERDGFLNK